MADIISRIGNGRHKEDGNYKLGNKKERNLKKEDFEMHATLTLGRQTTQTLRVNSGIEIKQAPIPLIS